MWQAQVYPTLAPNLAARAKLNEDEEGLEEWTDAFMHMAHDALSGVM